MRYRMNDRGEREVVPTPTAVLLALAGLVLFVWAMSGLVNA